MWRIEKKKWSSSCFYRQIFLFELEASQDDVFFVVVVLFLRPFGFSKTSRLKFSAGTLSLFISRRHKWLKPQSHNCFARRRGRGRSISCCSCYGGGWSVWKNPGSAFRGRAASNDDDTASCLRWMHHQGGLIVDGGYISSAVWEISAGAPPGGQRAYSFLSHLLSVNFTSHLKDSALMWVELNQSKRLIHPCRYSFIISLKRCCHHFYVQSFRNRQQNLSTSFQFVSDGK